jgi:hypothetical protein
MMLRRNCISTGARPLPDTSANIWIGPGDANASHARDFVKEIDPDGSFGWQKPAEPTPPSRPVPFDRPAHLGDDGTVRIVNSTVADPPRGTFSGDAPALLAAKTRGVMTPAELAERAADLADEPREEAVS